MASAQQRALPQSKEALLKSYNKRLKDDVKSMLDNFVGELILFIHSWDSFKTMKSWWGEKSWNAKSWNAKSWEKVQYCSVLFRYHLINIMIIRPFFNTIITIEVTVYCFLWRNVFCYLTSSAFQRLSSWVRWRRRLRCRGWRSRDRTCLRCTCERPTWWDTARARYAQWPV